MTTSFLGGSYVGWGYKFNTATVVNFNGN